MCRRHRTSIAALLALLALSAPATSDAASLASRIDAATRSSRVGDLTSVFVWEQSRRAVLVQRDAQRLVAPASSLKLLTSAAAFERLGTDHRFTTRIALAGVQRGTGFVGDIWLVGGGDPSLSTAEFARDNLNGHGARIDALAAAVRRRGIRTVFGRIMVDDDRFDEARGVADWSPGFALHHAGAIGALTVNESMLGRWIGGASARSPDIHAGTVFAALLQRRGVTVHGSVAAGRIPERAVEIGHVTSPPLHVLVRHMNQQSDNFYAEVLLKDIGADRFPGRDGISTIDGSRAARATLEQMGIDMSGVTWLDGSGLAYGDRVSARTLGHVLGMGAQADWSGRWLAGLPRSGLSGTLRHRMTRPPWRGRVMAKTGTLRHACALAGFSTRVSGARYGFALVTMGTPGEQLDVDAARRLHDRIAMILVR